MTELTKPKITIKKDVKRQYKDLTKRLESGYEIGEDIICMLTERVKIEKNFAKKLTEWQDDWGKKLEAKPIEYAELRHNYYTLLNIAQETANIHYEIFDKIMKSPVFELNEWLRNEYKNFVSSFIKKNYVEQQGIQKIQESIKEKLDLIESLKKNYHECCRKVEEAEEIEKSTHLAINISDDLKQNSTNNVHDKISQRDIARQKYVNAIFSLESIKLLYEERIGKITNEVIAIEETRIKKINQCFEECNSILLEHLKDDMHEDTNKTGDSKLTNDGLKNNELDISIKQDQIYTEPIWPVFEEYWKNNDPITN